MSSFHCYLLWICGSQIKFPFFYRVNPFTGPFTWFQKLGMWQNCFWKSMVASQNPWYMIKLLFTQPVIWCWNQYLSVLWWFVANIFMVRMSSLKLYAHLKLGFQFAFPLETNSEGHSLNEQPVSLGHLKTGSSNAFFAAWKDIFHSINSYKFYKPNL